VRCPNPPVAFTDRIASAATCSIWNQTRPKLDACRAEFHKGRELPAWCRESLGPDPSKWLENYNAEVERAETTPLSKAEFEATMANDAREFEERTAAIRDDPQLKKLETDLRDLRRTRADAAMAAAAVVAMPLLRPHVLAAVRVKMNGVEVTLSVVDRHGAVRTRPDGAPLGLGDMLKEMQTLDPSLSRCFAEPVAWHTATPAARNGNRNTDARQHQPARPRRHAPSRNKRRCLRTRGATVKGIAEALKMSRRGGQLLLSRALTKIEVPDGPELKKLFARTARRVAYDAIHRLEGATEDGAAASLARALLAVEERTTLMGLDTPASIGDANGAESADRRRQRDGRDVQKELSNHESRMLLALSAKAQGKTVPAITTTATNLTPPGLELNPAAGLTRPRPTSTSRCRHRPTGTKAARRTHRVRAATRDEADTNVTMSGEFLSFPLVLQFF